MNTRLLQATKLAAIAAVMLGCLPAAAQTIPANQWDVELAGVLTYSTSYVLVPNTSVTVNNATTARQCLIQFSSEVANAARGDSVDVAFAIGGPTVGAEQCNANGGPQRFYHASSRFPETMTTIHVRHIGTGIKIIKACFRLADTNPL